MTELRFRGLVGTGNSTFDRGISDLLVVEGATGPVLVSISGASGGLVGYDLSGTLPAALTWRATVADTISATGPGLIASPTGLLVAGLDHGGISTVTLSGNGILSWPQEVSAGAQDWSVLTAVGDDMLALADPAGAGFSLYQWTPGGNLMAVDSAADTGSTYAQNVTSMGSATVDGRDFVVVASSAEQGLTAYQIHNDQIYTRGTHGPADGLGMMTPSALKMVEIGERVFVLVGSAPANDGASGAISVMELGPQGQLIPTDHVMDTLGTRFGQIQDIATASYNGVVLLAVGGGDDGISLLALSDTGQLVHLSSFADTTETGLTGVTELEMVVIGDELRIFAASGADRGLSVLTADLSSFGTLKEASDAGGDLNGDSGDDILQDGAGIDRIWGGAGSDIFVLQADGQSDRIMDFDPAEDRLDLSSWPLLYDVNDIAITATATGALVRARGEEVLLISADRTPLTPDEVRAAIDIALNRVFLPPAIEAVGSSGADLLEGSWGTDVLTGGAGNDTLCGGLGDDTLQGGSGTDRAEFSLNRDDISAIWVDGDSVTLTSGEGTDVIDGVEWFDFNDGSLSLSQLANMVTVDTITGSTGDDLLTASGGVVFLQGRGGDDTLIAAGGHDTLWGGNGDDDLTGGAGNDRLTGGAGNDTLRGGDGSDWALFDPSPAEVVVLAISGDRATLQSADGTDVIDGIEFVQLGNSLFEFDELSSLLAPTTLTGTSGNDALLETDNRAYLSGLGGADRLTTGNSDDTLDGGNGNDTLTAGGGADLLDGGAGNDSLSGGDGNDTLTGGAGNDTVLGGAGTDRLVISGLSTNAEALAISGNRATLISSQGTDVIDGIEWVQFSDRLVAFDDLAALELPDVQRLNGDAGADSLTHTSSTAELYGYGGNDDLQAGDYDDTLDGGSGNDTLNAGRGNDLLQAGAGDDSLLGMGGDDTLDGGDGHDVLKGGRENDSILGGNGDDSIVGQRNIDTLDGGAGNDTVKGGGGMDTILGGSGSDFLKGGTYADLIEGGAGNDTLVGNRHDDTLAGGNGHDDLNGGGQDDQLTGGAGNDWLKGGDGADTFIFDTGHDRDVITDFDVGEDILALSTALTGGQSAAQIVQGAAITAFGVQLNFGDGDTILFEGITTTAGLAEAIDIV